MVTLIGELRAGSRYGFEFDSWCYRLGFPRAVLSVGEGKGTLASL